MTKLLPQCVIARKIRCSKTKLRWETLTSNIIQLFTIKIFHSLFGAENDTIVAIRTWYDKCESMWLSKMVTSHHFQFCAKKLQNELCKIYFEMIVKGFQWQLILLLSQMQIYFLTPYLLQWICYVPEWLHIMLLHLQINLLFVEREFGNCACYPNLNLHCHIMKECLLGLWSCHCFLAFCLWTVLVCCWYGARCASIVFPIDFGDTHSF